LVKCADRLLADARRRMASEDSSKPSKPDDLTLVAYRPALRL
jgi:hypothetical protein